MYHTDLYGANLSDTILYYADLSDADLRGAQLHYAKLRGTNLENAKVTRSQYVYISEANVKNIEKIIVVDDE